ncbi:MAG: pyridoxal phosphate-dependent aminotransferase family protein [Bacteroidota bacterium]
MKSDPTQFILEHMTGTEVTLSGKQYLYFAGTSYFQLHSHQELLKAANDATMKFGIGSATSRMMTGTTPQIMELEGKIAEFFGTEDAVYLPSGYLSNLAGFKALADQDLYDLIFIDESSHYSNIEGAEISGKRVVQFRHGSIEDLQKKLDQHLKQELKPLIASDGLFPTLGRLAPVGPYLELAEKYNGVVWIDDSHGVGILGRNGRGTCEHLELSSGKLFMGATLSKAFGAYGGIIPGSTEFIGRVRTGSVMTGSNSPMNAAVAAGVKGLELVREQPEMRDKLWENARYLKNALKAAFKTGLRSGLIWDQTAETGSALFPSGNDEIPIIAFATGDAKAMKAIHRSLLEKGIFIQYTTYRGTGKEGILRIVVSSSHTSAQMDTLVKGLIESIPEVIQ